MILIKDGKIQEVGKDIKCPKGARVMVYALNYLAHSI